MNNNNVTITSPISLMDSGNYRNMSTMKRTLKTKYASTFIKGAVPTLKGWLYNNKWFAVTKWMRRLLKFMIIEYKVYMHINVSWNAEILCSETKNKFHNLLLFVALL